MSTNPVIYLGQSSVQIGIELDRLCKMEKLCTPQGVYVDTRPLTGSATPAVDVMRVNMPHLFAYPSENSKNVEDVVDMLFRALERCDHPNSVGVVADFCSGVGSSLGSALITEIKDSIPHLRLTSVLPLPPENTIQGIAALNGLLGVQASLLHADAVILRGLDDALSLVSESTSEKTPTTLQEANMLIAADMYCALGPMTVDASAEGEGEADTSTSAGSVFSGFGISTGMGGCSDAGLYCWPSNVCSASNKLCDVRSSLWRLHLRNQHVSKKARGERGITGVISSAKTENYSPLRAMAANMHALHTASAALGGGSKANDIAKVYSYAVNAAMLGSIHLETSLSMSGHSRKMMNLSAGNASFVPSEVATLLHWACPETSFPADLGRHNYRDRVSGQTMVPTKQRQMVGSSNRERPVNSSISVLDTTYQSVASSYHSSGTLAADASPLAALAFASPYALKSLSRIYEKGYTLFERRAYVPKYAEVGVEPEDFANCMTHIQDVLLEMD